jgi:hypothetical protein
MTSPTVATCAWYSTADSFPEVIAANLAGWNRMPDNASIPSGPVPASSRFTACDVFHVILAFKSLLPFDG